MTAPYPRRDWQQRTDRAVGRLRGGRVALPGLRPVAGNPAAAQAAANVGDDELDYGRKVDEWSITGTGTSDFGLSFPPVHDSWNVSCSWPLEETAYSIDGQTLTIADPATVFINASSTYPKRLRIQYDYDLHPFVGGNIVGSLVHVGGNNGTTGYISFTLPTGVAFGDLMIVSTSHWNGLPLNSGWFDVYGGSPSSYLFFRSQGKFITTENAGDAVQIAVGTDFVCASVMTIVRGIDQTSPVIAVGHGLTSATVNAGASLTPVIHHYCFVSSGSTPSLTIDRGVMTATDASSGIGGKNYAAIGTQETIAGSITATGDPAGADMVSVALRMA